MARFKDNLDRLLNDLPKPLGMIAGFTLAVLTFTVPAALAGWLMSEKHTALACLVVPVWVMLMLYLFGPSRK